MAINPSFFNWYDTETTGLSAHHDQIIQFSSVRTDANLNYIKGAELNLHVKLRPDVVPGPRAFAVHGISIEELNQKGVTEVEAAAHIRNWFLDKENSMSSGYNTLPFDDEIVRNTMYRALQNPYEHEYKKGNSRSDIMRAVMLVYALRPHLLDFWVTEEAKTSLKLGDMCRANGIILDNAHDARSDVIATIELARKIKDASPQLWAYFLNLSDKNFVKPMIDQMKPLVLIDRYLSREKGHLTMALPVIYDARIASKMLAVDLREDPTELLSLPVSELKRRIFTPAGDLDEGESIKMIRDMTINKQPLIAEQSIFRGHDHIVDRAGLDIDACMRHAEMIGKDTGFRDRLRETYIKEFDPCEDVYEGIYSLGFISSDEEKLRFKARALEPQVEGRPRLPDLVNMDVKALSKKLPNDPLRMYELALRSKWGNYGEVVIDRDNFTSEEIDAWVSHLDRVWHDQPTGKNQINLEDYKASLADVRASTALTERQEKALVELEAHVAGTLKMIDGLTEIARIKGKVEAFEKVQIKKIVLEEPILSEEEQQAEIDGLEAAVDASIQSMIDGEIADLETQAEPTTKQKRVAEHDTGPSL